MIKSMAAALVAGPSFVASRSPALAGASEEITKTRQGPLRGRLIDGVAEYKGVAYAASTAGANRFLPPAPPPRHRGVKSALDFGDQCTQVKRLRSTDPYPDWVDASPMSENCLCLNIWIPAMERGSARAVMVWMHGGGYSRGSAGVPIYDGHNLAAKGNVVVVSVNHRLNIFGYAQVAGNADERFAASGNAGQLDLIAALGWVRDNIAEFGGDPSNVTIFGESGGGGKVSALLAMPAAQGLFHKAIVQSGSGLDAIPRDEADAAAARVYRQLGLKLGDVASLQRVSAAALYDCYEKLTTASSSSAAPAVRFGPVVDGRSIPRQTWTPDAPAGAHAVPMLIGINSDETAAFIDTALAAPIADDAVLLAKIKKYGDRTRAAAVGASLIDHYRAAMPALSRQQLLVRITTDIGMWRRALTQAERKHAAGGAPAYLYEFGWTTPCLGGAWALHALEVPFVFGNLDYGVSWDAKDSAAVRAAADPNGDRYRLSEQMIAIWTSFARTGNPTIAALGDWPGYTPERRYTMLLSRESHLTDGMRSEVRPAVMAL